MEAVAGSLADFILLHANLSPGTTARADQAALQVSNFGDIATMLKLQGSLYERETVTIHKSESSQPEGSSGDPAAG